MPAKLNKTEQDTMRALFEENGLTQDDLFKHQHYIIITRGGIEKIQAKNDIHVEYEEVVDWSSPADDKYVVKATAYKRSAPEVKTVTYGEVSPKNNRNGYPIAMAEKRALSRAILKTSGLYAHGVFGEDESDSFKRS
jgi:hypothetical protein